MTPLGWPAPARHSPCQSSPSRHAGHGSSAGCMKEANKRCSPGGNFPAAFAQPEIIFDFSSHPRVSHSGKRRKVSRSSFSSSPSLAVCQPPCPPPFQPRDKVPTLPIRTLLGPRAPHPCWVIHPFPLGSPHTQVAPSCQQSPGGA